MKIPINQRALGNSIIFGSLYFNSRGQIFRKRSRSAYTPVKYAVARCTGKARYVPQRGEYITRQFIAFFIRRSRGVGRRTVYTSNNAIDYISILIFIGPLQATSDNYTPSVTHIRPRRFHGVCFTFTKNAYAHVSNRTLFFDIYPAD